MILGLLNIIKLFVQKIENLLTKNNGIYIGDYQTWEEAAELCGGYGQKNIIEQVAQSVKKVIDKEAVYERDGYLFYTKKYEHYLLSYILMAYLQRKDESGKFTVIDWGGALASIYF